MACSPSYRTFQLFGKPGAWPALPSHPAAIIATAESQLPFAGIYIGVWSGRRTVYPDARNGFSSYFPASSATARSGSSSLAAHIAIIAVPQVTLACSPSVCATA